MTDDIIKPPPKHAPSTWASIVGNDPVPPWPGNRHERRARAARIRRGLWVDPVPVAPDALDTSPTCAEAEILGPALKRRHGNERTDDP